MVLLVLRANPQTQFISGRRSTREFISLVIIVKYLCITEDTKYMILWKLMNTVIHDFKSEWLLCCRNRISSIFIKNEFYRFVYIRKYFDSLFILK